MASPITKYAGKSLYPLFSILILVLSFGSAQAVQPTAGVSFAQVSFTDQQSPQAYSRYAQAFIDNAMLYGDGYINVERYENGKAAGWVVRNFPVESGSKKTRFTALFDLGGPGYQATVSAYVDFSPVALPDDSSLVGKLPLNYPLAQVQHLAPAPAENNPNNFEDVVCHNDDKKFWAGQQSVVQVMVRLGSGYNFKDGTGWIIKSKDATKTLMITASHNFTDNQVKDIQVFVNYQTTQCGGMKTEDFWPGEVDASLERYDKYDFVVVSLKDAPKGKTYPPALQALYKDMKVGDQVSIPQHPGGNYKKGGYYNDIANKKRCQMAQTAAINAGRGEIDAKCGAAPGTSGSPLLDAGETEDNTPFAIGLITAYRFRPLSAAGYKMSDICDYDAGDKGKKLLDCKKP